MDEDRRDGPGGAAGETEDSHPKHRWVAATQHHLSSPDHCFVDDTGLYMFV